MKASAFYIAKIDCATEEQIIRNRLKSIPEIESLDFNLMRRVLSVTHRLDNDRAIFTALESLGMGAQHHDASAASAPVEAPLVPVRTRVLMGISGVAALAAEGVAYASGAEKSWPVIALALLSMATGGVDTLRKGWNALRTLTLNINFLMTLAVVGAALIGQWPEAAMVTFLFGVAEIIEAFSLERARNAIRGLMQMAPETAEVWHTHEPHSHEKSDSQGAAHWHEMPASQVQIGQVVRMKPGERIPLDGVLTRGGSTVNQAPITGESLPVAKQPGDAVFAGTVNERGTFEFRVTSDKGHTTLDRIIKAVEEAQSERAPTQRFVDSFARYYTPAVVIVALLVAVVPPLLLHQPLSGWLYKALVMLVIACPCALVISTPVSVVSGLAAAARLGILVKGGIYLEEGRKLRTIALDKTGTLTHGAPVVTDVVPFDGMTRDAALQLAASLDAPSEHPVASAIVAGWTGGSCTTPGSSGPRRLEAVRKSGALLPVEEFEAIAGRGVRGSINGTLYFVGNHRLTEDNGVCGPHVERELERLESEGKTAVVLTTQHTALAVLGVADTLRETSVEAVKSLHELGIQTVMLTGDNARTARAIAARVGIEDARGDLLPEDKLKAIEELRARFGAIGMVGDGINDAPALAKASMGFAMGAAGTGTAIETADVALMHDDLRKLPLFIRLSRQTAQVLTQNIALALGIKIVFFALALWGHATLWMAVFADMGASLLVTFNGMRLLRFGGGSSHAAASPALPPVACCDEHDHAGHHH